MSEQTIGTARIDTDGAYTTLAAVRYHFDNLITDYGLLDPDEAEKALRHIKKLQKTLKEVERTIARLEAAQ